jgi:MAP/microtubule affinity-regulating kinase
MFFEHEDSLYAQQEKIIKVYKNGEPTKFFDLKIKKSYKATDLVKIVDENLNLGSIQKFRLFTLEGVEISTEELEYIKDGDALFASRGENFDKNSTLAEYEILNQLGEGGFGSVFLALHRRSKEKVAIKFLKGTALNKAHEIDKLYSEAETLRSLRHKNIVSILNCFTLKSRQVAFVMEYLEGGELLQYVNERKKLKEEEAREFFIQIAEAVSYCHRQRLIHCDLKLENLLLETNDTKTIKIVDFGISGLCTNVETALDAGSFEYMAPEFFNEKGTSIQPGVDIWAMGCILFAMVTGTLPFMDSNQKKAISKISHAEFSYGEHEKNLSRGIKDLISRMLVVDVSNRANIYEVLDHPWVNKQDMEELEFEPKQIIKLNSEPPKVSANSFVDKRSVKKNTTAPPTLKILKAQEKDSPSPIYRNSPNSNLMPTGNGKANSSPFATPKHDNSSLKSPLNSASKPSSNSSFKSISSINSPTKLSKDKIRGSFSEASKNT